MATVTFVLGYCGSGKSFVADQMERNGARKWDEGFAMEENLPRNLQDLVDTLRAGRDCVVVEIQFCSKENRDTITTLLKAKVPDVKIEWLAFENNLALANENCRRRRNKGDAEIHVQTNTVGIGDKYTIPEGATLRAIYRLSEEGT